MQTELEPRSSWLDQPLFSRIQLNWETIIFVIILVVAILSRFYDLESRVMSHDENTHVYYSWRFSRGEGLAHDPLMHGPFQFHLVALSYFTFGDNDFTARIPGALFSIATVGFMWFYRRYLGRAGAVVAALMFLISPYLLYYGRYVRNEVYAAFFGVVTLWAILRYLETGKERYTFWLIAVTALHFTAKETSFIYTAQALVFLAFYFILRVTRLSWQNEDNRRRFLIALIVGLLLIGGVGGVFLMERPAVELSGTETAQPSVPGEEAGELASEGPSALLLVLLILSALAFITAAYFLLRGYTWERLRGERSFGLLILLGTMILPQLAAFLMRFAGVTIPTNAASVMALTSTDIWNFAAFVIPLALIAIIVGLVWNPRLWLINAAIFYGLFTIFYTSVFSNGAGFFSGLVGSLGYWLEQQGVERGSQPPYYYWLVQIPVYEYLPALGTLLAAGMLILRYVRELITGRETADDPESEEEIEGGLESQAVIHEGAGEPPTSLEGIPEQPSAIGLFLFWSATSLVAYSIAGEKMPWLTVHIAWPMILSAAWAIGQLIQAMDWGVFRTKRGWLVLGLLPVFVLSTLAALGSLLGPERPFSGQDLEALASTGTFIISFFTAIASGAGLFVIVKPWPAGHFFRLLGLFLFGLLGFLTARVAITAVYINYDYANELLVYAHSAPGVKTAMAQIEEISRRTTDGKALEVAYDNETSYPYWWYLRNYANQRYFGETPTRSLREAPVILVGDANFGKIEQLVGGSFNQYDYIRLWWPNQDYYALTWERVMNAFSDSQMRAALFDIWLNRDYTRYGELVGRDMSPPNWSPAARMRLYIRKDIVAQLWNYGVAPAPEEIEPDPWDGKQLQLMADQVIGGPGSEAGLFQNPRDLEVAKDGSLYVVDTDNSRIQHLSPSGEVIGIWGSFADIAAGEAPGGTFNQPWGIGLGPDGSVYVADTWNHRIQKFNADGELLTMWGYFGQGESPLAFWGPRDVAVDEQGRVFVTDTGNKRVVVFDEDGGFLTEFGSAGFSSGQFDEPVGIVVDETGRIYVADTWNQRVQTFVESEVGNFSPDSEWEVHAWYGQSLDNKPYFSVDERGRVFASDPDGFRVLEFSATGEPVQFWGDFGSGMDTFGLPASVAADMEGGVWVVDSRNGRVMHFLPPLAAFE